MRPGRGSRACCRRALRRQGIAAVIPERRVNRLNQWRAVATRYEKRAEAYRAVVVFAALVLWLDSPAMP